MEIKTLASGSSGNCYRVKMGETAFLLDAGIPFRDIQRGVDFHVSDLSGCLITHEHGDHAKGAAALAASGVDLYASAGTFSKLNIVNSPHHCIPVMPLQTYEIGGLSLLPFEAEHDAAEPLGFIVSSFSERLLYLTDSAYCRYKLYGVTHMLIECNYNAEQMQESVKAENTALERVPRIIKSHMSLDTLLEMLRVTDRSKLQEIILIHMSDGNGDEYRCIGEVKRVVGENVRVAVALTERGHKGA